MFQYWPLNRALHLAVPVVSHQVALKRRGKIDSTMNGLITSEKIVLKMLPRLSFQSNSVVCERMPLRNG